MSYASVVLSQSPAVFLELQETTGTAAGDASGNGHGGTYKTYNGGTLPLLGQASIVPIEPADTSVFFDATFPNQDMVFTSFFPALPIAGSLITVTGWAMHGGNLDADPDSQFGFGNAVMFQDAGTGRGITFGSDVTFPSFVSWANATPANGTPYHFALTYNDTTLSAELFINAVSQGAQTEDSGFPFDIGGGAFDVGTFADGNDGNFWNGWLSHIALWKSILTPTQILAQYTAGTTAPASARPQVLLPHSVSGQMRS